MYGEISVALDMANIDLDNLRIEREDFILANEGVLPESVYNKKLKEYDDRIGELEDYIIYLRQDLQYILDNDLG